MVISLYGKHSGTFGSIFLSIAYMQKEQTCYCHRCNIGVVEGVVDTSFLQHTPLPPFLDVTSSSMPRQFCFNFVSFKLGVLVYDSLKFGSNCRTIHSE